MVGRPSDFTQATADIICSELATGKSLREVCQADDLPNPSTVYRWLQVNESFREQYTRAREAQAEKWADEIIDIADDGSNDWMERRSKDGEIDLVLNGEHVQRSRLRVDTRKWVLSKLLPKKYGDKVTTEVSGPDGKPIEYKDLNATDLARRMAYLLTRGTVDTPGDK